MIKKILIGLLIVLVVMQFFRIDKTNPPVDASINLAQIVEVPTPVQELLTSACYDCHSNETKYPWYTNLAPVSWWIKDHIDHGREELNFSEWGSYSNKRRLHKIEEIAEMVDEKEMPLDSYTLIHFDANLSDEQRTLMINWSKTLQ